MATRGLLILVSITASIGALPIRCAAQQPSPNCTPEPGALKSSRQNTGSSQPAESKRLFGIVPNYRTSPSLYPYVPMTASGKFKVASQDAFDRGTFILAALFAGEGQLTNANPSFGQGAAGYGQYLATSYADFVIGDFMTEGILPSLFHQDPRYFRDGKGGAWSRLGYAMGQIFWTHNDSGSSAFNYSEVVGNSIAVAISQSYYVDNRTWHDASLKLGEQLGVDMAANVLKEFYPEISHVFSRKHRPKQ